MKKFYFDWSKSETDVELEPVYFDFYDGVFDGLIGQSYIQRTNGGIITENDYDEDPPTLEDLMKQSNYYGEIEDADRDDMVYVAELLEAYHIVNYDWRKEHNLLTDHEIWVEELEKNHDK